MICFPFRAEMGNAASKTSYGACLQKKFTLKHFTRSLTNKQKRKRKEKKSSIYLKVKERDAREDRKQKSALMNEMLFS